MTCPCDNQCREECDICRDDDTIKKGMERMNDLPEKLPRENDDKIQEILNSNEDMYSKSVLIYYYYKSLIPYCRIPGREQEEPELHYHQIRMILEKR